MYFDGIAAKLVKISNKNVQLINYGKVWTTLTLIFILILISLDIYKMRGKKIDMNGYNF